MSALPDVGVTAWELSSPQVLVDGQLRPATLRIEDGRIVSVEARLAAARPTAEGGVVRVRVPDGVVVLPGVVDSHVHVNEPGRTQWEGFATATRAAALGGVTTIVDMPLNSIPPTTTVEALRVKQAAALAAGLTCDVAFWGGAVPGNTAELEPLWDAGVSGFKCFLADSGVPEFGHLDGALLREALGEIARFGGLMVVHAEDPAVLAAAPHPPSRAYGDFVLSRPDEAETSAIAGLLDAVRDTGARTHVLHLSSARALDLVAKAKDEGLPVTAETCHHYLTLAAEDIPDASPQFKCCPPIRDRGNRDALWEGLEAGILDLVVSDHSPATATEKLRGDGDLQQAWGGISGLQVGFTALAAEARRRGIGLDRVSRWVSAAPAALAGLAGKGRIAVGHDADLVLYDPAATTPVRAEDLAHRNPISAYDGLVLEGAVVGTVLRGARSAVGDGRLLERTHAA